MNRKIVLYRMRHNIFFIVGFTVGLFILLTLLLSPLYVQHDPIATSASEKFLEPEGFFPRPERAYPGDG